MKQLFLKLLEEIISFEEDLWILILRFLFLHYVYGFFGGIFLICRFQRSFVFDFHKEHRGGRSRGHKILANFGSAWFLGKKVFFSLICKDFLHLCGCLVLHCLLEGSSVYSSIIETKKEQRLIMKVGSISVYLLFCQFCKTCKNCGLQQRKLCYKAIYAML